MFSEIVRIRQESQTDIRRSLPSPTRPHYKTRRGLLILEKQYDIQSVNGTNSYYTSLMAKFTLTII
ncbi:MAG: hypothetical protein IPQ05_05720 [Leptospiraceae bacterium]|nr:hypothetical protein [Leptospiraceae bacterium]